MAAVVDWMRDKKGSIVLQSLFFVAIFLVMAYMGFEIWKVVSIKQSLYAATSQGAKFIALNGLQCLDGRCPYGLRGYVERYIVEPELRNNRFMSQINPRVNVWASFDPDDYCGKPFRITVEVDYTVLVPPRFYQAEREPLALTLSHTIRDELRCGPAD